MSKSSLHHFSYCGNLRKVRELLQNGSKADSRNAGNNDESPLHSCARGGRENATKVAALLLDSLDSSSQSELLNASDSLGKSAIFYAVECSAEALVGFLLENGATIPPEGQKVSDGNSLTHLAASNGSVGILKLLIGSGFPACTLQDGVTPLHICAQEEDTEKYAACVQFLASVYSGAEVNCPRQSDKKTALHILAESCNANMLKALLARNKKLSLLRKDTNKKIPLEYAVESCRNKKSEQCVDLLMKAGVIDGSDVEKPQFLELFSSDQPERSPLDAAIQFRSSKTVAAIITNIPERRSWIETNGSKCKQHLGNIYKVTPEALPPLMSQCLELSAEGESVEVDFGPITGYSNDIHQSKHLQRLAKNRNKRTKKAVLLHPLVQLYIEQRWNQLTYLNWISLLIRITWLMIYTILVLSSYDGSTCETQNDNVNNTGTDDFLSGLSPTFACNEAIRKSIASLFLIATVLLSLNEILNVATDFRSLMSYLKVINVGLALLTAIGCFLDTPPASFLNIAAFGFLLAFLLLFQEFAKRGYTEIAAFGKVIYRTFFLSIFVVIVLFAFRIAFKILLPSLKDQLDGPVQGFVKVLVLMTGEYDYKDIFHEGQQQTPSGGSFLFFLFVIIVTIALANLLTAFAVDDTERLMREARFYITETRLEQIHKWEVLQRWTSMKGLKFLSIMMKSSNWRESGDIVVIPVDDCIAALGGHENIIEELLNKQARNNRGVTHTTNGQTNINGEAESKC